MDEEEILLDEEIHSEDEGAQVAPQTAVPSKQGSSPISRWLAARKWGAQRQQAPQPKPEQKPAVQKSEPGSVLRTLASKAPVKADNLSKLTTGTPNEQRTQALSDHLVRKGYEESVRTSNLAGGTNPMLPKILEEKETSTFESQSAIQKLQANIDKLDYERTGNVGALLDAGLREFSTLNPVTAGVTKATLAAGDAATLGFMGKAMSTEGDFGEQLPAGDVGNLSNITTGSTTGDIASDVTGSGLGMLAAFKPITQAVAATGIRQGAILPVSAATHAAGSNLVQGTLFTPEGALDVGMSALSGVGQNVVNKYGLQVAQKAESAAKRVMSSYGIPLAGGALVNLTEVEARNAALGRETTEKERISAIATGIAFGLNDANTISKHATTIRNVRGSQFVDGLKPQAQGVAQELHAAFQEMGAKYRFTSGKRTGDGRSYHDHGEAVDIVSGDYKTMEKHAAMLEEMGFRVKLERDGQINRDKNGNFLSKAKGNHIHVTLKPRKKVAAPEAVAETTALPEVDPIAEEFKNVGKPVAEPQQVRQETASEPELLPDVLDLVRVIDDDGVLSEPYTVQKVESIESTEPMYTLGGIEQPVPLSQIQLEYRNQEVNAAVQRTSQPVDDSILRPVESGRPELASEADRGDGRGDIQPELRGTPERVSEDRPDRALDPERRAPSQEASSSDLPVRGEQELPAGDGREQIADGPGDAPTSGSGSERLFSLHPQELNLDPARFQFKAGGDDRGVVADNEEAKIKKWNPDLAGIISAWRDPADGKLYAVNGHHRTAKAQDLGVESVDVRLIDAPTAAKARTIGALINIAEGHGTSIDAAKVIRDEGWQTVIDAGVSPTGKMAREGRALSQLHPSIFQKVVNGEVKQSIGTLIGERISEPALQREAVTRFEKLKDRQQTEAMAREIVDEIRSAPEEVRQEESLFGTETVTESLVQDKLTLKSGIREKLASDKRLFGRIGKDKVASQLERGGNKIDVKQSQEIALTSARYLEIFDAYKNSSEFSDLFNRAIKAKREPGADKKAIDARVYAEVLDKINNQFKLEASRPSADEVAPAIEEGGGLFGESEVKVEPVKDTRAELRKNLNENAPVDAGTLSMSVFGVAPKQTKTKKKGENKKASFVASKPEVQERLLAASQPIDKSRWEKTAELAKSVWHKVTREFEHLPRTPRFADFRHALKTTLKGFEIAQSEVAFDLRGLVASLDRDQQSNLRWKVIYDNMAENLRIQEANGETPLLPFGYEKDFDAFRADHENITKIVSEDAELSKAVENYYGYVQQRAGEYMDAHERVFGTRPNLTRENYFHQRVLKYAEDAPLASGGKGANMLSRGWKKERTANDLDFSTSFWDTMPRVFTEIVNDTKRLEFYEKVKIDESDPVKRAAVIKAAEYAAQHGVELNWRAFVPEGYMEWKPSAMNALSPIDRLPEKIAAAIEEHKLSLLNLGFDEKVALRTADEKYTLVIPKEIGETLDNLGSDAKYKRVLAAPLRVWKWNALFFPTRVFKYLVRNTTGDGSKIVFNVDSMGKPLLKALNDIDDVFRGKKAPEPEFAEWMKRGGLSSTFNVMEDVAVRNDIQALKNEFVKSEIGLNPAQWGMKAAKGYVQLAAKVNDAREAIFRYANYISYLGQMEADLAAGGAGRPKNFGASDPAQVMAVKDIRDRAYIMSNELLGAYDNVSVAGVFLAKYMYPFFRYKEANFKTYLGLLRNTWRDVKVDPSMVNVGKMAALTVGKAAVKSPILAYRLGKFYVLANATQAIAQMWNEYVMPDEERKLPEELRKGSHVIFGSDIHGNTMYFNRISGFEDLTEMFGTSDVNYEMQQVLLGRKSIDEAVKSLSKHPDKTLEKMWKPIVNNWMQGFGPQQTAVELIAGKKFFPDVTNPRAIRDNWEHLFSSLGYGNIYKALEGKPSEGKGKMVKDLFFYTIDPREAAFNEVRSKAYEWKKEKTGSSADFTPDNKANAAYYFKQGLKYGDLDAAKKYLLEYIKYTVGDNVKSLDQPLDRDGRDILEAQMARQMRTLDPLSIFNEEQRAEFVRSLSVDERVKLEQAGKWLDEMVSFSGKNLKVHPSVKRAIEDAYEGVQEKREEDDLGN